MTVILSCRLNSSKLLILPKVMVAGQHGVWKTVWDVVLENLLKLCHNTGSNRDHMPIAGGGGTLPICIRPLIVSLKTSNH